MTNRIRVARAVLCSAAVLACVLVAPSLAATGAPNDSVNWTKGRQWVSARAGYAKSSAAGSANGYGGGGIGYARFLTRRWAIGAYLHDDLLGQFGAAAEIEIPFTLEIVRHTRWGPGLHPYLGLGGGMFYHKFYRTGDDATKTYGAGYLTWGANTPIGGPHVVGIDFRVARVPKQDDNPVFRRYADPFPVSSLGPNAQLHELKGGNVHWSVKVSYSLTY